MPTLLRDNLLRFYAENLDSIEEARKASGSRLFQMTNDKPDADGQMRGLCLPEDHPEVARVRALHQLLLCHRSEPLRTKDCCAEHAAQRRLESRLRDHPLGAWMASITGVGAKQGARLLAAVGDPYWHDVYDRPRLVSELWSYAGYGDAERQVRRKGSTVNWSPEARMRTHLVAAKCKMVLASPYRAVYDAGRERYADTLHPSECVRCGPSGKPAPAGSPRSLGHQDAMAVRLVAKELLRDLWTEAKRLHEAETELAEAA